MKEKEKKHSDSKPKTESSPSIFQKLLPHIIAVAVFAFITVLYFSPMILDNKEIRQGDNVTYQGASKELNDFKEKTGTEALWTNSMFGGMPGYQISTRYNGNLIQDIEKITTLGFPHPAELLFQCMLFFYLMLIIIGVNPWLAIGGALAYALGSYNLTLLEAGHNSKLHCIALMPLAVAGVLLLRKGKYFWGGIIVATGFSLLIVANHLQITYYLLLMLVVYGVVELIYAIREKSFRNVIIAGAIVVGAGIFSVANNLSLLWSTYEYLPSTIRGPSELSSNKQSTGGLDRDYAMQWSYGVMETFTLLIPNFYGGSSTEGVGTDSHTAEVLRRFNVPEAQVKGFVSSLRTYWGDVPFTSGPFYTGAIIFFLVVLSMFMLKERWKWWMLGTIAMAILLSWGRNFSAFNNIVFDYMPGYNKFRTPSMILVLIGFSFTFLSIVFLNGLFRGEYDLASVKKFTLRSFYISGGLCLLFAVAGGMLFSFTSANDEVFRSQMMQAAGNNQQFVDGIMQGIKDDRVSLMRNDALRSLAFIVLAAGLIWLFATGRIKSTIMIGGLTVLIFADLFFVGKRYLSNDNFISKSDYNRNFEPTQADQLILKETSLDYRVLNLATDAWQDSRTSYFHKSLGGYSAAKLRRYQEMIEHQLSKTDSANRSGFPFNKSVVDMLNTKYIIVPGQGQQEQVFPNTQALDNAWFIDSIKIVNNADEEMNAVSHFNPARTVIVDKRFESQVQGLQPSFDSTATVKMDSYEPNDLKYTSKSSKENVVVFSEIYYQPGWDAFIDGKKAEHFRCNYILRGMRVPAGEHQIEFKFEPESYFTGEKVAYASSGVLLLLVSIGGFLEYRRRKQLVK